MTELDKGRAGNGGEPPSEIGSPPFFPSPPGRHAPAPPPVVPLSAPAPHAPLSPSVPLQGGPAAGGVSERDTAAAAPGPGDTRPVVEGRVTIDDEVIEKIAAMAALEVHGVVMLPGRPGAEAPAPRVPGSGARPGAGGVRIHRHGDEVTLDLAIAVEYGSVIMDVARVVKTNVARVTGLMLGMRVAAVNVAVEDVRRAAERP